MTGRIVAFRAPGDPPVTPPIKFPRPPWPNKPPGTKKGGLRSQVVPLVPPGRPVGPSPQEIARYIRMLRDIAAECRIQVSFPAYHRSQEGDGA